MDNIKLNIAIEFPGTSACRIWYMTTVGAHGPSLRFYAMWSHICAAHVADPEVGSHPFSRVTGIAAGDDGLNLTHSTDDLDSISGPDGLKPCSVLQEWAQFCEEMIEAQLVLLALAVLRGALARVWGAADVGAW